jgi:hypothetical protein
MVLRVAWRRAAACLTVLLLLAAPLRRASAEPQPADTPEADSQRRARTAAVVCTVLGGASLAAAIGLGVSSRLAFNQFDDSVRQAQKGLKFGFPYVPTDAQNANRTRGDHLNAAAVATGITAAVLLDAALVVYLVLIRRERVSLEPVKARAQWDVAPAPGGARLALSWRF